VIIVYSRHLLGTGREKEALAALCYINGLPADDPIVQEALEELAAAIQAENEVCTSVLVCKALSLYSFLRSTGRESDMARMLQHKQPDVQTYD
jgi:hypothetical protein